MSRPKCESCRLHETCIGVVPAAGPSKPRLVVVLEAPGRDEDILGVPVMGRSGKVFDKALDQAGIPRTEVLILNTVLCRPPNNRKPKKDEIKACFEKWMIHEIAAHGDVPWVLMGAAAISSVGNLAGGVRNNLGHNWENRYGLDCWADRMTSFHTTFLPLPQGLHALRLGSPHLESQPLHTRCRSRPERGG